EYEVGALDGPRALDEGVVQRHESLRPRVRSFGDPQILENVLEEAVERQGRVDDERDRAVSVEPLTKGVKEGRLPGAHLPGQDDEALSLLGSVEELGERLPMPRSHVEESGVRGRVEGLFRESVEGQIHTTILN